ncbi:MAG: hypothetical protein ACFFDP_11030 [Promethearchaeota archaeon]
MSTIDRRKSTGLTIFIMALVVSILFVVNIPRTVTPHEIHVSFIPKELNSCPGHTAWLLANVTVVGTDSTGPIIVNVNANVSILTSYTIWSNVSPKVVEIFVYPESDHVNHDISLEIIVTIDDTTAVDSAIIHVLNWTLPEGPPDYVEEMRDIFINFLETNHPDYGINDLLTWTPIYNAPGILVVGHYLFMSNCWEMEVSWHVMIPPHDWVRVYIRPRNAISPIWAGQIESFSSMNFTIIETVPPVQIFR